MTQQHPAPTAADFFGQPTEEDAETDQLEPASFRTSISFQGQPLSPQPDGSFHVGPGTLWTVPPSPLERIADSLEVIASGYYSIGAPDLSGFLKARKQVRQAVGESAGAIDYTNQYVEAAEQAQLSLEQQQDTGDKLRELTEVIGRIEEALGKSTAKPALAAKAVIEEYRNPKLATVPEGEGEDEPSSQGPMLTTDPGPTPMNGPLSVEGHTRAETGEGTPDICQECSYAANDYVVWPCDTVGAIPPAPVVSGAILEGIMTKPPANPPASDAPVEEWREYARKQGMAGPRIDKANRSQIRTALGIAQPVQQ